MTLGSITKLVHSWSLSGMPSVAIVWSSSELTAFALHFLCKNSSPLSQQLSQLSHSPNFTLAKARSVASVHCFENFGMNFTAWGQT